MILNQGTVVGAGDVDAVLDRPEEAYTHRLLADTPALTDHVALPRAG
jgi:ABC-type microcin C transport system duplicated ATPase subunit YejF